MNSVFDRNVSELRRVFGDLPWTTPGAAPLSGVTRPDLADETGAVRAAAHRAIAEGAQTVALVGPGAAAALDVLRAHPVRAIVVAFTPADARACLSARDLTDAIGAARLALLVGPDYGGAAAIARVFGDLGRPVTITGAAPGGRDAGESARASAVLARLAFESAANHGARRATAGRYLLHTLANAPRIARESDAAGLSGLLGGMPAIIAAAGPSLDQNVHDLALVRDRAVLIACDTAARPLITLGVEPDVIVSSDASRTNAAHLSSLPVGRSWLVAEGSLHPSAFVHFDRRTFVFKVAAHEPWPWLASLDLDRGVLPTWGSVATSAFSLALAFGCNPIIFLGADFAFTDGRPYCRGTSFEPQWASWVAGGETRGAVWASALARWPVVLEPDLGGRPVRTAAHLLSFRDWIVERAGAHRDCRIVNGSGAGVLRGTAIEQQSAAAVLAGAPALDRTAIHRALRGAHQSRRGDLTRLLDAVMELRAGQSPATTRAWQAFTAGAVTVDAIAAALDTPESQAWTLAHARLSRLAEARA